MKGSVLSPGSKEDIRELMRLLQEEIIPKYNYLLEIDFPDEEELKEMKGLKEMLELTKPIIDSCTYILQNSPVQTSDDIFLNARTEVEKRVKNVESGYEMLKDSYKAMLEVELSE